MIGKRGLYRRIFKYGLYATIYDEGASYKIVKWLYFITNFVYLLLFVVFIICCYKAPLEENKIIWLIAISVTLLLFVIFNLRYVYQIKKIKKRKLDDQLYARILEQKKYQSKEENDEENKYMTY